MFINPNISESLNPKEPKGTKKIQIPFENSLGTKRAYKNELKEPGLQNNNTNLGS